MMLQCPKCDKDVARFDLDLYRTCHNGDSVVEEYCCHCPTCGHVFGVKMHYAYECAVITEEGE